MGGARLPLPGASTPTALQCRVAKLTLARILRRMDERFRDLPAQATLDLNLQLTAGEWLRRIRETSRTQVEKGQWFENLFARLARTEPAFELEGIWRWAEWPERERLTGLGGQDVGVDLVAKHRDGTWIAIQCKCYEPSHRVTKNDVQAFWPVRSTRPSACGGS